MRRECHLLPSPTSPAGEKTYMPLATHPEMYNTERSLTRSQMDVERSGAEFLGTWQSTVPRIIWTREKSSSSNERERNQRKGGPDRLAMGKRDNGHFYFSWDAWMGPRGKIPNQPNQPLKPANKPFLHFGSSWDTPANSHAHTWAANALKLTRKKNAQPTS
jgi:hypothetical protein